MSQNFRKTNKSCRPPEQQLFRKRKRGKQNSEHILVVIPAGAQELHPLGDVHSVVADALKVCLLYTS